MASFGGASPLAFVGLAAPPSIAGLSTSTGTMPLCAQCVRTVLYDFSLQGGPVHGRVDLLASSSTLDNYPEDPLTFQIDSTGFQKLSIIGNETASFRVTAGCCSSETFGAITPTAYDSFTHTTLSMTLLSTQCPGLPFGNESIKCERTYAIDGPFLIRISFSVPGDFVNLKMVAYLS